MESGINGYCFFSKAWLPNQLEPPATAEALLIHQKDYKTRVRSGKGAASALRLIDMLFDTPIISVPMVASYLGVTYKSALNALSGLAKLGILEEMSINARPKLFRAKEIIQTYMERRSARSAVNSSTVGLRYGYGCFLVISTESDADPANSPRRATLPGAELLYPC